MSEENEEIKLTDEERQPVECWTRVMGYLRPKDSANTGKRQEFQDRKYFINPIKGED